MNEPKGSQAKVLSIRERLDFIESGLAQCHSILDDLVGTGLVEMSPEPSVPLPLVSQVEDRLQSISPKVEYLTERLRSIKERI